MSFGEYGHIIDTIPRNPAKGAAGWIANLSRNGQPCHLSLRRSLSASLQPGKVNIRTNSRIQASPRQDTEGAPVVICVEHPHRNLGRVSRFNRPVRVR